MDTESKEYADLQLEKANKLAKLEKNPEFIWWRENVIEQIITSKMSAILKNPPDVGVKVAEYNAIKGAFERIFEIAKVEGQIASEELNQEE